jgi:hypothetical protein
MSDQWFSIVEYARTFSVSDMTVRRRIKNGKLKAVLKDGKYFIPVNATGARPQSAPRPTAIPVPVQEKQAQPQPERSFAVPSFENFGPTSPTDHDERRVDLNQYKHIPANIKESVNGHRRGLADLEPLLKFCDNVCREFKEAGKMIEESYRNKVHALEATIRAKDSHIKNLEQQIEDYNTLIKIFENKQVR